MYFFKEMVDFYLVCVACMMHYSNLLSIYSFNICISPCKPYTHSWGGTDLEKGYGDVQPWRPPFHASPVVHKGPISSKRVGSQDPLLRKFGNFSLYSLNFCPNFSSQAPKFGNFQLTSPQIWKFLVHKPPLSEVSISSQAPHFRNLGCTPLPEKKLSAPPDPFLFIQGTELEQVIKFSSIHCVHQRNTIQKVVLSVQYPWTSGLSVTHHERGGTLVT